MVVVVGGGNFFLLLVSCWDVVLLGILVVKKGSVRRFSTRPTASFKIFCPAVQYVATLCSCSKVEKDTSV